VFLDDEGHELLAPGAQMLCTIECAMMRSEVCVHKAAKPNCHSILSLETPVHAPTAAVTSAARPHLHSAPDSFEAQVDSFFDDENAI
jgi:hypothetical protein